MAEDRRQRIGRARQLSVALALLALLALAGCGLPGQPAGRASSEQETAGGLTIALERPERPIVLQDYELIATLRDAEGRPVDGASVYLDLTMPAHPMGVNQPIADALGGGRYRVRAVYSMEGDWRVTVVANVSGTEHRATFDHPVALPQQ